MCGFFSIIWNLQQFSLVTSSFWQKMGFGSEEFALFRVYIKHFQFNFHDMKVVFIMTWFETFIFLWALHHVLILLMCQILRHYLYSYWLVMQRTWKFLNTFIFIQITPLVSHQHIRKMQFLDNLTLKKVEKYKVLIISKIQNNISIFCIICHR